MMKHKQIQHQFVCADNETLPLCAGGKLAADLTAGAEEMN